MSIKKIILRIKKIITTNKFPFDYEPDIWKSVVYDTNCYVYALNSIYPEKSKTNTIYYVSAFSGYNKITSFSNTNLLERLYADFDALELKIKESFLDEVIPKDSYKIYFLSSGFNFYFFRYDNQFFGLINKVGIIFLPINIMVRL